MTGFYPTNLNTLYMLHLFYSYNEIITVRGRPEICTLIGWIETSRLCLSFNKVSWHVRDLYSKSNVRAINLVHSFILIQIYSDDGTINKFLDF